MFKKYSRTSNPQSVDDLTVGACRSLAERHTLAALAFARQRRDVSQLLEAGRHESPFDLDDVDLLLKYGINLGDRQRRGFEAAHTQSVQHPGTTVLVDQRRI